MITMLAGLGSAVGLWWLMKAFAKAKPGDVARLLRKAGGFLALALALLLGVKGRIDMAVILASGGAWLLGWSGLPWWLGGPRAEAHRADSRLRSRSVEIVVDGRTGRVDGRVLMGRFEGRALSSLSEGELGALHDEAVRHDAEGARLVEAYLHGRATAWREDAQGHGDARRRQADRSAMTEQEAYEILGLEAGADAQAVKSAHRSLMKRLHPDQGGSTYLASRVNQAKDVLLSRHR